MGLMCVGVVTKIKPAFKHYPPLLSIAGKLNHGNLNWHGEVYADAVKPYGGTLTQNAVIEYARREGKAVRSQKVETAKAVSTFGKVD